MPEIDRQIVALGVSQTDGFAAVRTHSAATATQFWSELERDYPKLREHVDTMLAQRLESGRLGRREYRFLVGTGGLYVEHAWQTRLGPYAVILDPSAPRGTVQLVAIEWAST